MALKFFTESSTGCTVAVNPVNVQIVREVSKGGCIIEMISGNDIRINEPFLEVIPKLNEK
jgi:hypothetical protein